VRDGDPESWNPSGLPLKMGPDGSILIGGSDRQAQSKSAPGLDALARFDADVNLDSIFGCA